MSEPKLIEPGKFELDLGGSKIPVGSAELSLGLDGPGQLVVTLSRTAVEIGKNTYKEIPETASLTWQGQKLFKGSVYKLATPSTSRLQVTYIDNLFLAGKHHDNAFVQEQTLREHLSAAAKKVGLSAKFHGDFSEKLPSLNLAGQSMLGQIRELSHHYGFHFFCHSPSEEWVFIRLDQTSRTHKLDAKTHRGSIAHLTSVEQMVGKSHVRYFDPKSMQSQDRRLSDTDLYSPVGAFKEHPGFRHKGQWKMAQGQFETSLADGGHFETSEALIRNQVSKAALSQEQLTVEGFEPLALPGDKLSVSNANSVEDGDYLVRQFTLRINGSHPKGTWVGGRI